MSGDPAQWLIWRPSKEDSWVYLSLSFLSWSAVVLPQFCTDGGLGSFPCSSWPDLCWQSWSCLLPSLTEEHNPISYSAVCQPGSLPTKLLPGQATSLCWLHRLVLSQMQDDVFTYVRLHNVCANLFLQTVPTNTSPAFQCTDYSPHFAVFNNFYHHMPLYKVPFYFSCRPRYGTGRLLKGFPKAFSSLYTLNNPSSLSLLS